MRRDDGFDSPNFLLRLTPSMRREGTTHSFEPKSFNLPLAQGKIPTAGPGQWFCLKYLAAEERRRHSVKPDRRSSSSLAASSTGPAAHRLLEKTAESAAP